MPRRHTGLDGGVADIDLTDRAGESALSEWAERNAPSTPTPSEVPAGWGVPTRRPRLHRSTVAVALLGLLVTAVLTVSSELSYRHNERRLTAFQTGLTASLLATAPVALEATLGRVAGLAAEASRPVPAFEAAITPFMAPKGPFASAELALVEGRRVRALVHLGQPSIRGPNSRASVALFVRAAKTSALVTSRATTSRIQKLGYLLSEHGPAGVFVVAAAQELAAPLRMGVPPSSPDADLKLSIYFGPTTRLADLVETNVTPPLSTRGAKATIPFGNNVLTLVALPRASLAGTWSEDLPWAILAGGVIMTLGASALTERLLRRRALAESVAVLNRELYQRQRTVSGDLQRALLPKALPAVPGFELAARYVPSTRDTEVGGDWYSVVPVDEHEFVFVIGDVSGHGISAAGIMASLRYTMRALAKVGLAPAEILERTEQELDAAADDHFATVLVGKVDTELNEMTLASAGHLSPLLLRGDRGEFLELAGSTPLGVPGDRVSQTKVAFEPGSMLVVFTDGLVERRGEPIDAGLERFANVAAAAPKTAEALISAVLGALTGPDHEDDIAILAIRAIG